MRSTTVALGCAAAAMFVASTPWTASAQETSEEPPKVQQISAVERGFFFETDVGTNIIVTEVAGQSRGAGLMVGLYMGYDIAPFLSILLGGSGVTAPARGEGNTPARSLFYLSPEAQVQISVITTERNFLWIRPKIGFAFALPGEIEGQEFGKDGLTFGGTIGFERYTTLRHFSVGIQAGFTAFLEPDFAAGITITPTLKYTF